MDVSDILRFAAIALGTGLVPGIGTAAGVTIAGGIGAAADQLDKSAAKAPDSTKLAKEKREQDEKQAKRWIEIARKLERKKKPRLTSEAKAAALDAVIASDLLQRFGTPAERMTVETYRQMAATIATMEEAD